MAKKLVINPGSTSTKLAVFDGEKEIFLKTLTHSEAELSPYSSVVAQKAFRSGVILSVLEQNKVALSEIKGIIAIGGLLAPCQGGVYEVNSKMLSDLNEAKYGEHAANLGALIAHELAVKLKISAYIADPITTDEMMKAARISGMPEIKREGKAHALNQKSVAMSVASSIGKRYDQCKLVVAHLGGGISVVAHKNGQMVDTNSARGEGPFCIDRTGGLNAFEVARLCYSGKFTREEMLKKINGGGGVVAYLSTRDFRDVVARKNQEEALAQDVFEAMAYQISKEIGAMAVAVGGSPDAIVLTGGMANSKELTDEITSRVDFLGTVVLSPGERELEALSQYLEKVLSGELTPATY